MTTTGLTNETHMIQPLYSCLQRYLPRVRKSSMRNGTDFIEEFKNTADQCLTLDKNRLDGPKRPIRFLRKL